MLRKGAHEINVVGWFPTLRHVFDIQVSYLPGLDLKNAFERAIFLYSIWRRDHLSVMLYESICVC